MKCRRPTSRQLGTLAVVFLVAPSLYHAAAQASSVSKEAAAIMAQNCYTCHGPKGVSPGTIPSLHNLRANNIAELLKAFRDGTRPSTVMGRHAKGYTDEQIQALAEYIAEHNKK
jgi:sulfide dehydrogenase cytochrome subunit